MRNEFEELLNRDPDSLEARLVYGDWLAEQGDPWGELIQIQHAIATLPAGACKRKDELTRIEVMLLYKHARRLWGLLGETLVNADTQTYACDTLAGHWRSGFLQSIRFSQPFLRHPQIVTLMEKLASLPAAQILREMCIGDDDPLSAESLALIAAHGWRHLQSLHVRADTQGQLSELLPLLDGTCAPGLERVDLHRCQVGHDVSHALRLSTQLRSIACYSCDFSEQSVAELEQGTWPKLEVLKLVGRGLPSNAQERLAKVATKVDVRNLVL